jgi:hypothetical protein
MDHQHQQRVIENYIEAYNNFDVEGMILNLHDDIKFQNSSNGEINLEIHGKSNFQKQAEHATQLFTEREQKITDMQFTAENEVEIRCDYRGVLAMGFPNGLNRGDEINLKGKSVFRFREGMIVFIKDIS